jgi:NitT/TauT family transport system substrate-binding protein
MGYFANVQFAPFYVAQQKGYYRQAGLDVHFRYGIEPDLLRLASVGKVDFVNSGGDEVLTAGAHGLRVRYVLTQYSRFPSAVFSLHQTGIRRVSDLRGRSVGIPYSFGASYVGLLALLDKAGIAASSVSIKDIGFQQVESVAHHKVDAAVGYAMQEPIVLRQEGYRVQEFDVYHWANIAGAGIATGDAEISQHPDIVRAFVQATIRGMADTIRNPGAAYAMTVRAAPAAGAQPRSAHAILVRALDFWRAEPGHPTGWIDPAVWSETARLLYRYKQIPHPVSAMGYYTNRFVLGR